MAAQGSSIGQFVNGIDIGLAGQVVIQYGPDVVKHRYAQHIVVHEGHAGFAFLI